IDEFNLNSNCLEKRAEIEVYLSGAEFEKKEGSGKWYSISATLKTIKLGERVVTPDAKTQDTTDGDIPF
ncbi:MAG: hypothetical protein ACTJHT_15455, partial [Sphingobacterium sp.]